MIENSGRILTYKEIDREEWRRLVAGSATGTWFQSPEAFDFYASMPELFTPIKAFRDTGVPLFAAALLTIPTALVVRRRKKEAERA